MTPHAFYKTDANQGEIAAALRLAGHHVTNTAMIGDGFPDLHVCDITGRVVLFETKTKYGRLTEKQRIFRDSYPGELYEVRTSEMALEYMENGHLR